MSIYPNVTEHDLIILRELAEQQKEQRALKIKNRMLKQTHDVKLAESLSFMTKNVDQNNETTQKIGDLMKKSNSENENNQEIVPVEIQLEDGNIQTKLRALPNSSVSSDSMIKPIDSLMSSFNSVKTKPSPSCLTILGDPIYTLGCNKLRIRDNDYELTPEVYKALSYTGYTGKTTKDEKDILMMHNNKNDLGYTGVEDRPSNRKTFLTITLPKVVDGIQNRTFDELDIEGQGIEKLIIPSNIVHIFTRPKISLGLKLSGHNKTLPEASNLIDELYKRGEKQNEQQYRNAVNETSTL